MRNRWFHQPKLHTGLHHEKKVSWLELFFDLIFVAAIIQLGDALSNDVTRTHYAMAPFARFVALYVPLWTAWTGFTFYANRFDVDDFLHRALVFSLMISMGAIAVTAPSAFDGHGSIFAGCVASAYAIVALMYARAIKHADAAREYSVFWGAAFAAGAVVWLLSMALSGAPQMWVWVLGSSCIMLTPMSKTSRALSERYPIDWEHLAERYGLLTIIVLGESFVKVLGYLSGSEYALDFGGLMRGLGVLTVTCSVWWIYFDDVAGAELKEERASWILWMYGHLPLAIGVTAVGVGLKKAIGFDLDVPAPDEYRALLTIGLVCTFLAVAMLDSVTRRKEATLSDRSRVNVRAGSAILIGVLGAGGGGMTAFTYLALVAAICVGQVIFDMISAPLTDEGGDHAMPSEELATVSRVDEHGKRRKMPSVEDVVRRGTPAELRSDLYFFLIDGSWTRLFAVVTAAFLISNAFFAGLYLLDPASVSVESLDFPTAFFFSVQTMSTIGYGGLAPADTYGNMVVTVESAVGLLGVALATGIIFAKVSRPTSSVLFSRNLIVRDYRGKKTLSFRVGNARGNDLVEAKMTVSAIIESVSPEGEHMRHVTDLALTRNRTPIFSMTWTLMHTIDEDSPLHDIDLSDPDCPVLGIVCSLIGHDGTYGQQAHARQTYELDDVLTGHRFVDVMSSLEDGRLMIDYHKFHDTVPD